jgi:hypothetical protein
VAHSSRFASALAVALALLVVRAAPAATGGELFDLLQPGSRPALGLGGDPFLSPLEDATGWWSSVPFRRAPAMTLDAFASSPVTEAAAGGGALHQRALLWTLTREARIAGVPLALATRVATPQWRGRWGASTGGVTLGGEATRLDLAARVPIGRAITLQAIAPAFELERDALASSAGVGLRVSPTPALAAQASWTRARAPERFESDLYGEVVRASLNLRTEDWRVDAEVKPWRAFQLGGSVMRATLSGLEPRHAAPDYELSPAGRAGMEQGNVTWGAQGERLLARWTREDLDLDAIASWGGQRFARIDRLRGDVESWLVGLERPAGAAGRLLLDGEWSQLRADALGQVETWPFTSTTIDLLGIRRLANASARARWTRWHAGFERRGKATSLELGAAWVDLWPEASMTSWRPVFLVFGATDERGGALRAYRVQLASLSLGATRTGRSVEVAARVRQFVYAHAFEAAARSQGETPPPSGDRSQSRPRWPGGTQAQLTIARRF